MNRLIGALLGVAMFALASISLAAEGTNPTGTWKWSNEFNGKTRESTLTLILEGDKLTGHMPGRNNTVTPIEEGTYKDGEITFNVTRERNGVKSTTKYAGKVSGDKITGKITSTRDGKEQVRDWEAKKSTP